MKMLCGMFVLRLVTTAHMTASKTKAKMNPVIAHLQALLTSLWRPGLDIANLIEVVTTDHLCSFAKNVAHVNDHSFHGTVSTTDTAGSPQPVRKSASELHRCQRS